MRTKKYILAIDFDGTITRNDRISKSWGDRLAQKLDHLRKTYPIKVYVLSVANVSHIIYTVVMSGSVKLLMTFLHMPLVTNESVDIERIDHNWGESVKTRKQMIKKITKKEDFRNTGYIIAYKKTNYLIRQSTLDNVPHSHIYFLDDNHDNIHFATYYGFRALTVDNSKKNMNIFDRLDLVEEELKKSFLYYKT